MNSKLFGELNCAIDAIRGVNGMVDVKIDSYDEKVEVFVYNVEEFFKIAKQGDYGVEQVDKGEYEKYQFYLNDYEKYKIELGEKDDGMVRIYTYVEK